MSGASASQLGRDDASSEQQPQGLSPKGNMELQRLMNDLHRRSATPDEDRDEGYTQSARSGSEDPARPTATGAARLSIEDNRLEREIDQFLARTAQQIEEADEERRQSAHEHAERMSRIDRILGEMMEEVDSPERVPRVQDMWDLENERLATVARTSPHTEQRQQGRSAAQIEEREAHSYYGRQALHARGPPTTIGPLERGPRQGERTNRDLREGNRGERIQPRSKHTVAWNRQGYEHLYKDEPADELARTTSSTRPTGDFDESLQDTVKRVDQLTSVSVSVAQVLSQLGQNANMENW